MNSVDRTVASPSVGDLTDQPGCSYQYSDGPLCGDPSRWHVIALDDTGAACGLEACERHLAEMTPVSAWVHSWTSACADGGGFSPVENQCIPG